jgi:Asp-tRNA(Asn)/Glu-tRNA(Gln) amidotransferase A subunit family amidase
MTDDLCWMTSAQLVDRYRLRDLSPLEVAHAMLRLLEKTQPEINAFSYRRKDDPSPSARLGGAMASRQTRRSA